MSGAVLPPVAKQRLRSWIRSRHLVLKGNFLLMESLEQNAIDRFAEAVESLDGHLISVNTDKSLSSGNRTIRVLQGKASMLNQHWGELLQYWAEKGGSYSRFDERG
ncbi:CpeR family transcriptional regulator [Synechococcus sp. CS-1326]|uniref:CpeR family transcriptional regulator n=1 Tax=Synechococcus sp. CS-1326 TaxID=2847978 RepID=UPI00223AC5BD|nr:CpeR family transcriptional regulator [Synechococcus sp. CS-1326]MCT0213215.1 CpeR family transcriptional regulator [Synechococcus sp. CS-1326]